MILEGLSPAIKSKVQERVDALLKQTQAQAILHSTEVACLGKELEFHRTTYKKYNAMITEVTQKLDRKRELIVKSISGSLDPLVHLRKELKTLELSRDEVLLFLEKFEQALELSIQQIGEIK